MSRAKFYDGMPRAQSKMALLHAKKEREEQRRIPLTEVATQTGVNRRALGKWYTNSIDEFHGAVILALCQYYGCSVGDLLTIEPIGEPNSSGVMVFQAV